MGISKKQAWSEFAGNYGAKFIDSGFLKGVRVEYTYKDWPIYLDTFTVSTGKGSATYTRVRALYVGNDDFSFKLNRKSVFSKIAKALGKAYTETGDTVFDEKFVIKSNDEIKAKALFSCEALKEKIISIKKVRLSIKNNEGKFGPGYQQMGKELYFYADGVVKDPKVLSSWFDLYKITLDELESKGLSSSQSSKVVLFK